MQTRSQSKLAQSKPSIISTRTAPVTRSSPKSMATQPSSPVTRSQTQKPVTPVFDFDEASAAWLLNKNKLGNGTYSYKTQKSVGTTGMTTRSGKVLSA